MVADATLEDVVLAHVRYGRRSQRDLGLLMLAFTAAPFVATALRGDAITIGSWGVASVFAALAVGFFVASARDPASDPVFALLRDRRGDVVWAYVSKFKQRGSGSVISSQVVLGLADGRRVEVSARVGHESELLTVLGRALPNATVGYDAATEAAFTRDPASLGSTSANAPRPAVGAPPR